jgi:hypothetical protein
LFTIETFLGLSGILIESPYERSESNNGGTIARLLGIQLTDPQKVAFSDSCHPSSLSPSQNMEMTLFSDAVHDQEPCGIPMKLIFFEVSKLPRFKSNLAHGCSQAQFSLDLFK